ncbi:MAG: hypothetical protein HY202_00590 [Nitrospirae bacterium]|nr:hypothetical protein [Nitrospirota bacterium]
MSGGKSLLGCLGALAGIVGIFAAITISFTFYLIPVAFLLFIGSLIMISLALGPSAPPKSTKHPSVPEDPGRSKKE